ncbi:ribosome assembly cofactor RimP [Bacteroidota bacterium]
MIEKGTIEAQLTEILEGTGIFLVDIKVDNNNKIRVHVDTNEGISIDDCVRVSRALEGKLDRDQEDFALEVSSPGLDAPFKVLQQYEKSIGKMISVKCNDGRNLLGTLKEMSKEGIQIELPSEKKGGKTQMRDLTFSEIQSSMIHVQF